MKIYSRHLKPINRPYKKIIIFTSTAVALTSAISFGSYLMFNSIKSSNSLVQEQDIATKLNEETNFQDDSEAISVSKVENFDSTANEKTNSQKVSDEFSVSRVKSFDKISSIENSLAQNTSFETWNKTCEPNLVVVNCKNSIPENFANDIVDFKEVKVSNIMKDSLYKMINDASREGINLWISSAYRSIDRQANLYNREVDAQKKNSSSLEEAKRLAASIVAEPGKSEHNTGLAVDFNGVRDDFFKSKEYNWLIKNSAKYGFVLRYKKEKSNITNVVFEPWHFRYVGEEHAKIMNEKELCLEEYVSMLMQG